MIECLGPTLGKYHGSTEANGFTYRDGEEWLAYPGTVVQVAEGVTPGPELELIEFGRQGLAHSKCPRSVDFDPELPRLPAGKLYKPLLPDRYWGDAASRTL